MSAIISPFGIKPDQRIAVFIDGPSFYSTTRLLGFEVDYRKLRQHFEDHSRRSTVTYFTAIMDSGEEYSPVIKLVDWLSYNQFRIITKPMREYSDGEGRRRVKGNMQVEMTVEMMKAAKFADHIILFTGDGDMTYAVEAAQEAGVRVTVVSSVRISVSDELRRSVDRFIDIADVRDVMYKRDSPPTESRPFVRDARIARV